MVGRNVSKARNFPHGFFQCLLGTFSAYFSNVWKIFGQDYRIGRIFFQCSEKIFPRFGKSEIKEIFNRNFEGFSNSSATFN